MRLGTRLLWPLLTVVGAVMLAYGAYTATRRERFLLNELSREMDAYSTALSIAVEYAVSDGDLRDLEPILKRIADEPKIYGVIVYDSVGRAVRAATPLTLADAGSIAQVRALVNTPDPPPQQRVLHGERFYSVFRPLRAPGGRVIGALEVMQPLTESFREVGRTRARVLYATLILVLGVAVVLLVLVRRVVASPLQQLVAGARALGRGELTYRIDERGPTELSELSVEFNRMATHLQTSQENLLREAEDRLALERQLRSTEKLAAVGNLAAGLAHEIAAPLNVVAGRAEMLRRTDKPAEVRDRDLRIIIDQIGRITGIVRNLLDFARRREPHVQPLDVAALVSEVLDLLDGETERAGVKVESDVATDLRVKGDPQLLHQVLVNLLMNAIQSVEQVERERRITVRAWKLPDESRAAIEVADNGVGLPLEIRSQLFEPFFTTKPPGRGTGLGLPVVRSIVEEHGGSVSAESAPDGEGAIFRIVLPRACENNG